MKLSKIFSRWVCLFVCLVGFIPFTYADDNDTANQTVSGGNANPNLSIYPTLSYVNADARNTISYYVINTSNHPITIKAAPAFVMTLGQKDSPFAKDTAIPGSPVTSLDLSNNLIISPQVFTIMPGQARTVRASILPNHSLSPGGYAANILFSSQTPPKLITPASQSAPVQQTDANQKQEYQINLTYLFDRIVTIYANKGIGYADKAEVSCVHQPGSSDYVLNISNNTPWFFDGTFSLKSVKDGTPPSHRIQPLLPYSSGERSVAFDMQNNTNDASQITWQLRNSPAVHEVSCTH